MLFKMAFRNAKRQVSSYVIYFITVSFTIGLLFAIINGFTSGELAQRGSADVTSSIMAYLVIFICWLIITFIVCYATAFLLGKRKKEFGIYLLLGINRFSISKLFFIENLIIGSISFIVGCGLGLLLFELFNIIICSLMGFNFSSLRCSFNGIILTIIAWTLTFIISAI